MVVGSVLNFFASIFSFGRKKRNTYSQQTDNSQQKNNNKVFSKEDGEYVDFEEVKE
jgi:hypothetical protein